VTKSKELVELEKHLATFVGEAVASYIIRSPLHAVAIEQIQGLKPGSIGNCVLHFTQHMIAAKKGAGPLCLCCDHEFNRNSPPNAFAMWMRHLDRRRGDPANVTGICGACCEHDDDYLICRAQDMWSRMFPGSRNVHAGGD
jgi:hypothetical protein